MRSRAEWDALTSDEVNSLSRRADEAWIALTGEAETLGDSANAVPDESVDRDTEPPGGA